MIVNQAKPTTPAMFDDGIFKILLTLLLHGQLSALKGEFARTVSPDVQQVMRS